MQSVQIMQSMQNLPKCTKITEVWQSSSDSEAYASKNDNFTPTKAYNSDSTCYSIL
jgi:hypothetical protein